MTVSTRKSGYANISNELGCLAVPQEPAKTLVVRIRKGIILKSEP